MSESNRTSIILLNEGDESTQALVQMKDGDKFFVVAADAARACSAQDKVRDFGPQFRALLVELTEWLQERRERIRTAHLTFRQHDTLFLVMQKEVPFDDKLSAELSQLDLRIANAKDFSLIDLEVLLVPLVTGESSKAFLSSGQVYTYAQ